jgi:hypothetical protein
VLGRWRELYKASVVWYSSDGRRELCKVNYVVVRLSGDRSARALQGRRCGGRPPLGGLVLTFSSLSKTTFIELPFDNCRSPQLTLRSTIYHSLIAESSLIANISLVADCSLFNSTLVVDCSIHTTDTCHVDIDAENQARWGPSQRERHGDMNISSLIE